MGKIGNIPYNFEDLTGKRFGRLIVIKKAPKLKSNTTRWECKCDCGNIIQTTRSSLIKGSSKSCGCYSKELNKIRSRKYNKFEKLNKYYIGYTTNTNDKFIIDEDDFDRVSKLCWNKNNQGYISTRLPNIGKMILLHRFILENSNNKVDHINRNRLDNRKENLRFVTSQQNCMNKSIQSNNHSGILGVYFEKTRNKWIAKITYNGKIHFKRFEDINNAIKYRKELEKEYFKEYSPI